MTPRYSWPSFRRPLRLEVSGARVDGRAVADGNLDPASRRLALGAEAWARLEADLVLDLGGQPVPDRLKTIPGGLEGLAVLTSEAGYVRIPVPLRRQAGAEPRFTGRLDVARAEVGGVGRLEGEIVGQIAGVGHRVLGTAEPWSVAFDALDAPPSAGRSPVRTVWVDFAEPPPGLAKLSSYERTPIHIDFHGAEPVVYLNSGLTAFQTILTMDHARGARKTVRDLLGSWMATTVMLSFARAGLRELRRDEDGTISRPQVPAVDRALDALVGQMQSVETVEQLAERLAEADEDPSEQARLWGEVILCAHRLTGAGQAVEEAAKRVLYE